MSLYSKLLFLINFVLVSNVFGNQEPYNIIFEAHPYNGALFVQNDGQWDDEVLFFTRTNGMNAWITEQGVVFNFFQRRNSNRVQGQIIHMEFNRSDNREVTVQKVGEHSSSYNFITGNNPDLWTQHVYSSEEVIIEGLYAGIDVRYYYEAEDLRYDFILNQDAHVNDIEIAFHGIDGISLDNEGDLLIATQFGEVTHSGLKAYQIIDGESIVVDGNFTLLDNHTVGFDVQIEDETLPLIIDPLIASTFLGGSGFEVAFDMNVHSDGNVYVTGIVESSDFPVTSGAYEEQVSGEETIFISKFNPDLSELLSSTFLGGSDDDRGYSLAVDSEGYVYITGSAYSNDFPVTDNAYSDTFAGFSSCYISVLSPDLSELVYSTALGGADGDDCFGITLGSNGNIYVTGTTYSDDFPTTQDAYNRTHNGDSVIFVSILNHDLSDLLYSTLLGGSGSDNVVSILLDEEENIYIAGSTSTFEESDFPITPGAFRDTFGGVQEGIVSKFNPDVSELLASTYLGGSDSDIIRDFLITSDGMLYIFGETQSTDFPTTSDAFDRELPEFDDKLFIAALSADLDELHYGTYLGGAGFEDAGGIGRDATGNIYVAAATTSSDYPTTEGAFIETFNQHEDAVLSILNPELTDLMYSTFIGGSHFDSGRDIALNSNGQAYIVGGTRSANFPVTSGAFSETHSGSSDIFISKFEPLISLNVRDWMPGNIPEAYELLQNYPNPFNPATTINFEIAEAGQVQIAIYTVLGVRIKTIVDGYHPPGSYSVTFDAVDLPSGVYIYTIQANDFVQRRKMVYLK